MPKSINNRYLRPQRPYTVDLSRPKRRRFWRALVLIVVLLAAFGGAAAYYAARSDTNNPSNTAATTSGHTPSSGIIATTQSKTATNPCAANPLSQLVLVSISKQHLWACNGTSDAYDSAVVTGMEQYPADLTPTGTYHVYAKETNLTLTGSDSTGSWSDPVSYWMPFLNNQYGEYGFHDATWRTPSQFGNVNINAPYTAAVHGSHGCVELPFLTAKWLYNWSVVGTAVTIET